jgi:toxin-antitoxin system PIN domain toxin
MILVDANLLIYAFSPDSPFHARARLWLEEIMNGDTPVAFPLVTILAFLRIMTHPKLPGRVPSTKALATVRELLASGNATVLHPGERHFEILGSLAQDSYGPAITDAHVAALTIEHQATLHTQDSGFRRFSGLRVRYPLEVQPSKG